MNIYEIKKKEKALQAEKFKLENQMKDIARNKRRDALLTYLNEYGYDYETKKDCVSGRIDSPSYSRQMQLKVYIRDRNDDVDEYDKSVDVTIHLNAYDTYHYIYSRNGSSKRHDELEGLKETLESLVYHSTTI